MSFTHGYGGSEYGITEIADAKQADKEQAIADRALMASDQVREAERIGLLTRLRRAARRIPRRRR